MKQQTSFSYKKAIIVDSNMLNEMDKEIRAIYEIIKYEARTVSGDKIEFESLKELLGYENAENEKLVSVDISARDVKFINTAYIFIKSQTSSFADSFETVSVTLTVDDVNKKTIFKNNIMHLLERYTQNKKYNAISKTEVFILLSIVYIVAAIFYFVKIFSSKGQINTALSTTMIILCALYCLGTPIRRCRDKYYPRVVFYLGDQIKQYEELKGSRQNFFWTVCIGGVISVIMGVLSIYFSLK